MPERALSMEEGVADLQRRAHRLADLEQEFEEVRLDRDTAWEAATIAQNRVRELERELAVESAERVSAWTTATAARERIEQYAREQRLNKPLVAAYWNIRSVAWNQLGLPPSGVLAKIRLILDEAASGQREATETPGDQAMVAAQQQRADIDNIAERAAADVNWITGDGT